jgi:hypothetical protein
MTNKEWAEITVEDVIMGREDFEGQVTTPFGDGCVDEYEWIEVKD